MRPALGAWGRFVVATVSRLVKEDVGADRFNALLKVPPGSRVKDKSSALEKVVRKNYDDPLDQMTDLVGARFVVLLRKDIEIVENVVIHYSGWVRSKDRNPEDERDAEPSTFDYQSVHYVLRNNQERELEGVTVPAGLPCELQIRTLLQHAYSELVHDNFYKGKGHIPVSAKRLVARSMALMETTDEMFCAAVDELDRVNKSRGDWCAFLDAHVGPLLPSLMPTATDEDAMEIIETYKSHLDSADTAEVRSILTPEVAQHIRDRAGDGGLFAKPVVLLVYWIAKNHAFEATAKWPVPSLLAGFDQVKSDIGAA